MSRETVNVELADGIAWVTLDRPEKRNAMNPQLNAEMVDVLLELDADDACGVLVLTGAGDSFAAGLAFGYLQDADVVRAAQYGNAMGAQRCTGSTLDVYLPLPQTNKQLADTYGSAFKG